MDLSPKPSKHGEIRIEGRTWRSFCDKPLSFAGIYSILTMDKLPFLVLCLRVKRPAVKRKMTTFLMAPGWRLSSFDVAKSLEIKMEPKMDLLSRKVT